MVERERETVVVTDGDAGRGSGGIILAIVIVLAVIVGAIFFVNLNTGGQGGTVSIDVPAVDVTQ